MDYQSLLNHNIKRVKPSGIRKFFDIAEQMRGIISLGVGEPDFQTPWHIRQAGIRSLELGKTRYTSNWGMLELREQIADWCLRKTGLSYRPEDQVLVTVGGSEGIDMCVRAVVNPGDEVLIPEPCFVSYTPIVTMSGGVPVPIPTVAENEFRLTAQELQSRITGRTKLLILPYPNNPTGAVMRKEHLEEIARVLRGTDILVLSDEIYGELTYGDRPHCSIAALDGMYERTVVVNGFSKSYSMTGWRLGFAYGPGELIEPMTKLHQYAVMCTPTTAQYAAIDALKNGDEDIQKMRGEYDMRRRLIVNGVRELGLPCFEPQGAFYIFPDIRPSGLSSEEFCERLLYSQKVAVVPGTAFGDSGEGFVRISYSYSLAHINEALKRIGAFLAEL